MEGRGREIERGRDGSRLPDAVQGKEGGREGEKEIERERERDRSCPWTPSIPCPQVKSIVHEFQNEPEHQLWSGKKQAVQPHKTYRPQALADVWP